MKQLIALTGVTRGLGYAMTQQFIAQGHTLLGCARSADAIQQLRQQFPSDHHFAAVDIAEESQVKAWAEEILTQYGPPTLLINNAGFINQPAPLWQISSEEFSRVIDINLKGVAHTIRHFVPATIARGSGIIVNFSSGWGRATSPQVAPYCASKWAIEGMTQALAQELPAGMAAIALNPGIIHTDMLEICFGKDAAYYPQAKAWARKAVPFLLNLNPQDNGKSLTIPAS